MFKLERLLFVSIIFSASLFGEVDLYFSDELEIKDLDDKSNEKPKQIVAVEFGFGKLSRLEADTISKNSSIERDVKITGIKLGAEDIGLRLFLSYRPLVIEDTFTNSFGLELDSTIDIKDKIKFFYGLAIGFMFYEIVDKNMTSSFEKNTTPYYGLEAGFVFNILDNIELESGFRYLVTNINDSSADTSYMFDIYTNYYFGLNFKY